MVSELVRICIDHQEVQKAAMDHLSQPTKLVLNPFNYFEWKTEITLLLEAKGFTG
jgi:hypothetical protein